MAASANHDVVSAEEHEISCPICLDEFEEPKCLPNCAHNVCQQCLEGMNKKNKNIVECPVCRVESTIPKGGVKGFPKNHLLVRLIERSPGRKEKQAIKDAVKKCSEKLEGAKTALQEMENRYVSARYQAEEVRRKIRSLAENVISLVTEQEKNMLSEIDQKMSENRNEGTFDSHKSNGTVLCENATGCVQTVEDILRNADISDLRDLKDALVEELNEFSEALESRMFWANCEFTQPFDVSLNNTALVEKFIQEGSLGSLAINIAPTSSMIDHASNSMAAASAQSDPNTVSFSNCGSVIQTIDSSSAGIPGFKPFSVAVSKHSGHFVVLDEEKKRVHVFNEEGEPLRVFRIMYGDLWDIAISSEDEIIVLNRESNRILHYDMAGNFKKKFVTTPIDQAKFTSVTVDLHGRFVICSSPCYSETQDDTLPCALLYNASGKFTSSFGHGRLSGPEKAVFVGGKFFVADSHLKSILVFGKDGEFQEEIAKDLLEDPSCIVADRVGYILVCDRETKSIQIFNQRGLVLHRFQTEDIPLQIAFTKNFKNLLICFEGDGDVKYIQMLTYAV